MCHRRNESLEQNTMRSLALALLSAVVCLAAAPGSAQESQPAAAVAPATQPASPESAGAPSTQPAAAAASTQPATAAVAPSTQPAALTEAPAAKGMLSVTSTPAGKVFLDEVDTGLTTPVTDFAVATGKHTLKVLAADGRSTSSEFTIEGGGALNLNLNLPEAEVKPTVAVDAAALPTAAAVASADVAAAPADDWTWMTVGGWSGLGLGSMGLLAGAVVLTTPDDADQSSLGFGLFGGGVGLVLGGAVLLYLDNEMRAEPAPAVEPSKAAESTTPAASSGK